MKIVLPLTALGLLSTLFLISNTVDPSQSLPTTTIDLASRAENEGATNTTFAGVTRRGDEVRVTTATARPSRDNPRIIEAFDVTAQFNLISGTVLDVVSDSGDLHHSDLTATLQGDVRLVSTIGYKINTAQLDARLDELYAETPGAVTGTGPPGDLVAGRMILTQNPETEAATLRFTDGVKLIYRPNSSREN
ncbi:MAG: LPS export ABC transporter periplasmic protein LptC [Pseudomonadota bacterium]